MTWITAVPRCDDADSMMKRMNGYSGRQSKGVGAIVEVRAR